MEFLRTSLLQEALRERFVAHLTVNDDLKVGFDGWGHVRCFRLRGGHFVGTADDVLRERVGAAAVWGLHNQCGGPQDELPSVCFSQGE